MPRTPTDNTKPFVAGDTYLMGILRNNCRPDSTNPEFISGQKKVVSGDHLVHTYGTPTIGAMEKDNPLKFPIGRPVHIYTTNDNGRPQYFGVFMIQPENSAEVAPQPGTSKRGNQASAGLADGETELDFSAPPAGGNWRARHGELEQLRDLNQLLLERDKQKDDLLGGAFNRIDACLERLQEMGTRNNQLEAQNTELRMKLMVMEREYAMEERMRGAVEEIKEEHQGLQSRADIMSFAKDTAPHWLPMALNLVGNLLGKMAPMMGLPADILAQQGAAQQGMPGAGAGETIGQAMAADTARNGAQPGGASTSGLPQVPVVQPNPVMGAGPRTWPVNERGVPNGVAR